MITLFVLVAFVALYFTGWLKISYTGITKPLCQVTLFGFGFAIKRPDKLQG